MTERKTVVYPNPEVLAQAVAARTLLTIADLLASRIVSASILP